MSNRHNTSSWATHHWRKTRGDDLTHLLYWSPDSTENGKRWPRLKLATEPINETPLTTEELQRLKEAAMRANVKKNILYILREPLDTESLYATTWQVKKIDQETLWETEKRRSKITWEIHTHEWIDFIGTAISAEEDGSFIIHGKRVHHYNISTAIDPKTNEIHLTTVCVVRNTEKIEAVLRKLHSMNVRNWEDKVWVEYELNQVLNKLIWI